jgi:hypothetical protein
LRNFATVKQRLTSVPFEVQQVRGALRGVRIATMTIVFSNSCSAAAAGQHFGGRLRVEVAGRPSRVGSVTIARDRAPLFLAAGADADNASRDRQATMPSAVMTYRGAAPS